MKLLKNAVNIITNWFERGDLVPLIVIVSAVHYSVILHGRDFVIVAIAIGLLVDLGHYRWVRAAVRYNGANNRERLLRWALAFGMTVIAIAYQQRYYADWWLSLPLPLLIISLAWLAEKNKRGSSETPTVRIIESEPKPDYLCDYCGYEAQTQNALNGHMRKHKPRLEARRNGREVEHEKTR
jgi:hypothetical protein